MLALADPARCSGCSPRLAGELPMTSDKIHQLIHQLKGQPLKEDRKDSSLILSLACCFLVVEIVWKLMGDKLIANGTFLVVGVDRIILLHRIFLINYFYKLMGDKLIKGRQIHCAWNFFGCWGQILQHYLLSKKYVLSPFSLTSRGLPVIKI